MPGWRRVTAPGAGGGFDGLDQLGEDLAPLGVLSPFAVLDVCPFGVA
jgi:hypothetical protein